MKMIVGLGNPGSKYSGNRHNIGFMAVDEIHRRNSGFQPWKARFQAQVSEGRLGSEKVLLIKPSTFMNESGRSVGEAMRFFKLAPEDIVVIYDELDLPPAKFRMKTGGGHGGHNGLRSITAHIGADYRRLRLGIGHPGDKKLVSNYVLGDFAKADQEWLAPLLGLLADQAPLLAQGQDSQFANKLTLALEPEKAQRKSKTPDAPKSGPAKPAKAKGQSHIRQARQAKPASLPNSGPMADMLKKLLRKKNSD
ncbi:aminoacyl-tRNA hydrolase [Roseibium denhamense]|uniref:Peptidyl-tRNA hydrolase n=1 Tax=Roseibium denhamense TaxID=76305 RepID=A0ABY1NF82_9HYPH|nr:aminoacyl-tRNA hydrolase [Roseibium denhamense]MTI06317.1 aminoacyl-tRNA hydrolase [Roseibium denhamense]SMP08188.1 peptidyl-tRNA hydrolase [Roseibium denhamense]